jgi:hypothetical protein
MPTHDRFEELCALASAGEIGSAEAEILERHLEECLGCRSLLSDLREIHAQWLPAHQGSDDTPEIQDWRLRQAILKQTTSAGARFSREAVVGLHRQDFVFTQSRYVAIAVTALIIVVSTFLITRHRSQEIRRSSLSPPEVVQSVVAPSNDNLLRSELTQTRDERNELERQLENSRAEVARLEKRLSETEGQFEVSQQTDAEMQKQVSELQQQLESARGLQSAAVAELSRVKATDEALSIAERQEIRDLNRKLDMQSASLDREREMLGAGREIRDLIAARNLHIVDVYDTNGEGKTSRAFGRVFYTEGKSLVFYAYDLNTRKTNLAKFAFYVWGKRDGAPQDIKSLGRMSTDDREQKRWALTITDPRVLAEIDSVFVTLEPADAGIKPSGKPLLSAFLGTPANHP